MVIVNFWYGLVSDSDITVVTVQRNLKYEYIFIAQPIMIKNNY